MASPLSEGTARERIQRALDTLVVARWPLEEDIEADLEIDAGDAGAWTVSTRRRHVSVSRGRVRKPSGVVSADGETMAEVLEGHRSGAETFLKGFLRVRGDLALAMRLEGLLDRAGRPRHFPTPHRVNARGIDTFYLEAGDGPPVIALHGLGATNASMLPTVVDLARDHRVIAPDNPGFGESAKPLRAYHAEFFAEWVVGLMDRLGIRRAHLVGNSMGGRIALEVALRSPERVDRLALFAPAVAFRKLRQFAPLVRALRPELGAVPLTLPRAAVIRGAREIFSRPDRLPEVWFEAAADEFLRVFHTLRGRIALFSAARQIYLDTPFGEAGFWARLAQLSRPALFIWGDRDILVPAGFARHVEEALPKARSVVLQDCGHVPQFELPERTHALVRDFFSGR